MQLLRPVEPFGEVNLDRLPDGKLSVRATILMEPDIEGAGAGLALDGSASMKRAYGANLPLSPLFKSAAGSTNYVEPVARMMAEYLAKFSSEGKTHVAYWACGADGSQVEVLGDVTQAQAGEIKVGGPKQKPWGRKTQLLPPVKYFAETVFPRTPWAICVFLTDGVVEDLDAVTAYSRRIADQIAKGQRKFIKFVLLGIGEEVDETQMTLLDDMFEGSGLCDPRGREIDLWDHKLVSEMTSLTQIFAEVVDESVLVAPRARLLDDAGRLALDLSDGLPARIQFTLAANATAFTLELPEQSVTQHFADELSRL